MQELYKEDCCGGHEIISLAGPSPTGGGWEGADAFLKAIHSGALKPGQIDSNYYNHVADTLKSGAAKGLGGTTFGADNYRNTLKAFLDQNIYAFSGAKSLYMAEQYRSFLTDADGKVLSESAFISKVADLGEIDNVTHLKAERNSAIASAQMAEKWQGLQAFPALEYRTVGDDRVRPEHAILDGLVLATDDARWSTIYPPNGWNCRCTVLPAAEGAALNTKQEAYDRVKAAEIQPYFKRNVGKEKLIYSDNHPYIQKIGVDKLAELDAEKNYGLRSAEKIMDMDDLPTFTQLKDKATANAWWEDQAGSLRGSFDLKSVDGLQVTFDNEFRNHVLDGNKEDRFKFLKQLVDVLQNPDEVWSNRLRGTLQNTYIKYYGGAPIILAVEAETAIRAISIYEATTAGKISFENLKKKRKGTLKYKNR